MRQARNEYLIGQFVLFKIKDSLINLNCGAHAVAPFSFVSAVLAFSLSVRPFVNIIFLIIHRKSTYISIFFPLQVDGN